MKTYRLRLATIGATVLAMSLVGCGAGSTDTQGTTATELKLAVAVDNDTFDPAQLSGGAKDNYWQAVYDTVLKLNYETLKPEPNLATEWSYNSDKTELTVKLRDDVKFSDGSKLTAEALKVNALALRDNSGSSSIMMTHLADVQVVDEKTAVYKLKEADPAFVGYLTTMGGAIGNPKNVGTKDIATKPAGSGPYILDDSRTVAASQYVFKRNPAYWNTKSFPYDEIDLLPINEASARVNAVKSHQVNGGVYDPAARQELESSGLKVGSQAVDWRGLMLVDREGKMTPALSDVRVRQAINYALDRKSFLDNIELGQGVTTSQIFIPGNVGYVPELDNRYPFDPAKAKELLKEAGYADGFDLVLPAFDFRSGVQPVMVQQLADVGIRVKTQQVVPDQYNSVMKSGKFSAFWMQLTSGDAWRNVEKTLPAKATWNSFHTQSPELTALIDKARAAYGDDKAYKDAMGAVSTYIVEQAYFAPWYRINSLFVTDNTFDFTYTPWATTPELRTYRPTS
ncbi:ABC transporter substrate-binding protein [Arthrobacter sp. NPDC058130]|uniref:ABC transporter substrate-binding protein n=1 Tax=Arthrobacter sp. NPDC058130 TaxID=3346353 RepID=UPI0036EBCBF3